MFKPKVPKRVIDEYYKYPGPFTESVRLRLPEGSAINGLIDCVEWLMRDVPACACGCNQTFPNSKGETICEQCGCVVAKSQDIITEYTSDKPLVCPCPNCSPGIKLERPQEPEYCCDPFRARIDTGQLYRDSIGRWLNKHDDIMSFCCFCGKKLP